MEIEALEVGLIAMDLSSLRPCKHHRKLSIKQLTNQRNLNIRRLPRQVEKLLLGLQKHIFVSINLESILSHIYGFIGHLELVLLVWKCQVVACTIVYLNLVTVDVVILRVYHVAQDESEGRCGTRSGLTVEDVGAQVY